jgi:phosphohistidine swiveling domain-containing protein
MNPTNKVIQLSDPLAQNAEHTGGKGANLAALTGAGFPVPDGFVVTTAAYSTFIEEAGLWPPVEELLAAADYDDAAAFEETTAEIRRAIADTAMPTALAGEIAASYDALPPDAYVAVRSSGTAEDLAGTSFAGLHDTYLDVRGPAAVADAVKRCWASMWTARATHYRHNAGIDHAMARIAVVVQEMVESEVSGVLFTANPLTANTEQMVVNANWGLGESVVSGIATPDSWVLDSGTLAPVERTLGEKELRIVRDPDAAHGTITYDTPAEDRKRFALTDDQLADLGALGRLVQTTYDELPQDIEWAIADGRLHLLQSRPVTGVDLSWDGDVDEWQTLPDRADAVWTRTWADEQWTGAVTPLFYSWRAEMFTRAYTHCADLWGVPEMKNGRMFKFHKAEAYFHAGLERAIIEHTVFPVFRPGPNVLNHVPPAWHGEILSSPFSIARYLKMHARITAAGDPANTPYAFLKTFDDWFYNRIEDASGLPDEQLRRLSDRALERHVEDLLELEFTFAEQLWAGYYLYARDAFSFLGWMLAKWYDGDNPLAFGELLSGAARRTATLQENIELLAFAEEIRESPSLRSLFDANEGNAFFTALEETEAGRDFLARYQVFAQANAHRGHAERDIYYKRRLEDPSMDYRAWQTMLSSPEALDPEGNEHRVNARRDEVLAQVVENVKKRPFGFLRAELFKLVHDWLLKFLIVRDDERYYIDRSTYSAKRAFLEIGRRLLERGIFETDRDVQFLSRSELYEVLRRNEATPLVKAKIAGRMRDFDRFVARETKLPVYLQGDRPAQLSDSDGEGDLNGVGTSHGTVTGRARVLHGVEEIGRVQQGDILVTNHTDPGWTPVFLVISGIVLETGGMLAHGSLLAREYGFPAVQVAGATDLIPDGALITVDGDTGTVHLVPEDEQTTKPELAEANR